MSPEEIIMDQKMREDLDASTYGFQSVMDLYGSDRANGFGVYADNPSNSSIDNILKERGDRYGEFEQYARITQALKDALRVESLGDYDGLPDYMKEALEMICNKMGRIVNGDPYYADSWVDITGYSQLVVDELAKDSYGD